jgi:hypothetical protein
VAAALVAVDMGPLYRVRLSRPTTGSSRPAAQPGR